MHEAEKAPKAATPDVDNRTHLDTSRREAALGKEAMQALRSLNVLIIGCRGAGIEAAKNISLLGPKAVTVWDPHVSRVEDMGCNFYLNKLSIDRQLPRSKACSALLEELNPFCRTTSSVVPFKVLLTQVSEKKFSTVIVTDLLCVKAQELRAMSTCCHSNSVPFLMALASGVTASLFTDFGPFHVVKDPDGQPTNVCVVESLKIITLHKDDAAGWLKPETGFLEGAKMILINIANDKKKALENGLC